MGIHLLGTTLTFDCGARVFSKGTPAFFGTVLGAFVKPDRSGFRYVCLTEGGNVMFCDEQFVEAQKGPVTFVRSM